MKSFEALTQKMYFGIMEFFRASGCRQRGMKLNKTACRVAAMLSGIYCVLMIYKCFGQMVKQQTVISTKTVITRNELKSGMYFYRLISLNGQTAYGRFVIAGEE